MLPASNRGDGQNAGFPDTVNTYVGTATVPITYPNIAMNTQASGFATTVYVAMVNALNLSSSIPMTNGDEAGTAGPNMGRASYTMGNPIVNIEKVAAISLCCPTTGNNSNCGLAAVLVPSTSVVSYSELPTAACADGDVVFTEGESEVTARITRVTRDVARRLRNAVVSSRAAQLVLDLRGCPGGDLEGALDLASGLVEPGAPLIDVVDLDGDVERRRARGPRFFGGAVLVVVDGGTASAAEVLAAALQDTGAARVAGEPTYGKGSIRREPSLKSPIVARVRRLTGAWLDTVGVHPS